MRRQFLRHLDHKLWRSLENANNRHTMLIFNPKYKAEETCKAGYGLKSNRKLGWEVLLRAWILTGEHSTPWATEQAPATCKSSLFTMIVYIYTTLHERTPSFCIPQSLECNFWKPNVKIPLSCLLNTWVNNLAQPEQSLNLRESTGFSRVRCTFFPRPTWRNSESGTSFSVRDWDFFCFILSF